jgi:parvulin-like peptidyl-prolyl isomerase
VNAAQQEAGLQKITAARERALAGEDFGKLAQEVSESATKENGGLIGPVNVAEIAPAMRERIDGIKTGEISEPIRTTRGYQVLKVESRSEAKPQPFAQVREQILRRFQVQRVDAEM